MPKKENPEKDTANSKMLNAIYEKLSSSEKIGHDTKKSSPPTEDWRPRLELDENGGFLVSTPRKENNTDSIDILKEFKLDPEQWTVTSVRTSRWQRYDEEWLTSYRLNIMPKVLENIMRQDMEEAKKKASTWKPRLSVEKSSKEGLAFIFAPSDQQIGKTANGEGAKESVERILDMTQISLDRYKELKKIGRPLSKVVVTLLGDHIEGIVSQNGRLQAPYSSDLGLTEQIKVARQLLFTQVKAFAEVCPEVVVAVVNGNHDEVTRQMVVDPAEGWNTEIARQVADMCSQNEHLSKVEFRYPSSGHQTLALNVGGTMLGLFHGHQMKSGGALKYISGQAAGNTPIGNCDVWLSGHYHHFKSEDIGQRFWAQCPTLDPGSPWFRDRTGMESDPGILTMVLGKDHSPKRDLSIITRSR